MCMQNIILSMMDRDRTICGYREVKKTGSKIAETKNVLELRIIDNICIKCKFLLYKDNNYLINEYYANGIITEQYDMNKNFFVLVLGEHTFKCGGLNGQKYSINKIIDDQYSNWKILSNNVESSGCKKKEEVCCFECNEGLYEFKISEGLRHTCGMDRNNKNQ